ncbi:MAG: iron-containing alcohol dehydrogenase [Alphaproteobacteria bacterium]
MAAINFLNEADFDHGAIQRLGEHLTALGIERPMLVTDQGLVAAGIADQVKACFPDNRQPTVYADTPPNPTQEAVEDAAALYAEAGCDGIVSLGGGSAMDLAKGVGILAKLPAPLEQYGFSMGGGANITDCAPMIAIPTTAGTGSEVSVGAVIILKDGRKDTFFAKCMIPDIAVCDPDLTLGLPPVLTAATGMDAMTHCIEAVLTPVINPVAEGIGLEGIERGIRMGNLQRAVEDGQDKDARFNMMVASFEGALAFTKGLGSVHAIAHAAGRLKELKLHHGTLNAVALPTVLRFNKPACEDKFERIARAMNAKSADTVADEIEALNEKLGLPSSFGEMGITTDMIPDLVAYASTDLAHYTNPVPATPEDYEQMLKTIIG